MTRAYPPQAEHQSGVFTHRQALECGIPIDTARSRLRRGTWRRVAGKGLIRATDLPDGAAPSAVHLAWAAALTWPESVVAGRVAAVLHGLPVDLDGSVTVYTGDSRTRPCRGVVPWRAYLPADRVRHGRPRVTGLGQTVTDCLAHLPLGEALDLFAWSSTRRVYSHDDLAAAVRERFGRPGTRQLLRLLRLTRSGAVSGAEMRLHDLLRRAGLVGWHAGAEVRDAHGLIGVVDVLFARERVVVEVDGERAHSGREAFVRDRQRQNRLTNAGFRVLRFTWWDLAERPDRVVAEIRTALTIAA